MEDALVRVVDLCKVYNPGENEVRALDHEHAGMFGCAHFREILSEWNRCIHNEG